MQAVVRKMLVRNVRYYIVRAPYVQWKDQLSHITCLRLKSSCAARTFSRKGVRTYIHYTC